MTDDLDVFTLGLQAAIDEDTKKEWGEKAFRRWESPPNAGRMDDADSSASLRGVCGDQISIYLKFHDGRVEKASFVTDGCGPSIVCGRNGRRENGGRAP